MCCALQYGLLNRRGQNVMTGRVNFMYLQRGMEPVCCQNRQGREEVELFVLLPGNMTVQKSLEHCSEVCLFPHTLSSRQGAWQEASVLTCAHTPRPTLYSGMKEIGITTGVFLIIQCYRRRGAGSATGLSVHTINYGLSHRCYN